MVEYGSVLRLPDVQPKEEPRGQSIQSASVTGACWPDGGLKYAWNSCVVSARLAMPRLGLAAGGVAS